MEAGDHEASFKLFSHIYFPCQKYEKRKKVYKITRKITYVKNNKKQNTTKDVCACPNSTCTFRSSHRRCSMKKCS